MGDRQGSVGDRKGALLPWHARTSPCASSLPRAKENIPAASVNKKRKKQGKGNVILTITEQKFLFQVAVLKAITSSQLPMFQSKLNGAFCNTQGHFLSRSHYSFIERHLCTLPQSNLLTNIRNSRDGAMGDSQIKYSLISFRQLYRTEQPKGFRVNLSLMACGT